MHPSPNCCPDPPAARAKSKIEITEQQRCLPFIVLNIYIFLFLILQIDSKMQKVTK